jgi:plastocyanin
MGGLGLLGQIDLPSVRHGAVRVFFPIATVWVMAAACVFAADVTGTVIVKQRLSHPSVTAPISMYERGPAVELGRDNESDPLAAERARVVIWIEGNGPAAKDSDTGPGRTGARPSSMEQINRRFDPDIVVIPKGGSVTFPNMDPIFHNVFSLSKPKSFDLGNYPKGDTRTVVFPKPGIVYVNCRLHPNMAGVVVVTPNQWFAKADRDGAFALHNIPAGIYTVVAWHKTTGSIRKEIQVVEGRGNSLEFLVPIDPGADSSAGGSHSAAAMQGMNHEMNHPTVASR